MSRKSYIAILPKPWHELKTETRWDKGEGKEYFLISVSPKHISQDRAGCSSRIVSLRKTWLRTRETEMHVQMAVSRPSWTSPLPALPAWLVDRTKLGEWRVARSAHAETWSNSTWPFFSQDLVSPRNTQKDTLPLTPQPYGQPDRKCFFFDDFPKVNLSKTTSKNYFGQKC